MPEELVKIPDALLFEQVPCYVSVQTSDGRIIQANRRFRDEFGDRSGDYCYRVFKRREDKCPVCPMERSFQDGQIHQSEEVVFAADGQPVHVMVTTAPIFNRDGQVVAIMEIATNITETKKLQRQLEDTVERYRTLFDEVPCYISVQDREFRIVDTNRRFKEEFGHQREGFCYELYKHRAERCEVCPVAKTFEDGLVHSSEEVVTSRSGEPVNVLVYTAPIRDGNDRIVAVMEMSTNISDIRRMQSQLANVGELVAGLAHTVKGIVMGLDGGMYVVESGFMRQQDDVIKKGWDMVQRNVERVSHLVLDMLYYARDRVPEKVELKPDKLCRDVCDLFEKKFKDNGIRLKLDISRVSPFQGDPKALHTLILNLIENAIDACRWDKAKTEHTIILSLRDQNGDLVLTVTDNGVGIDQEAKSKLFTVMHSTKGGSGTGFGLLVAKKIVDEHGGRIDVHSEPGQGTTFTVSIPRTSN